MVLLWAWECGGRGVGGMAQSGRGSQESPSPQNCDHGPGFCPLPSEFPLTLAPFPSH